MATRRDIAAAALALYWTLAPGTQPAGANPRPAPRADPALESDAPKQILLANNRISDCGDPTAVELDSLVVVHGHEAESYLIVSYRGTGPIGLGEPLVFAADDRLIQLDPEKVTRGGPREDYRESAYYPVEVDEFERIAFAANLAVRVSGREGVLAYPVESENLLALQWFYTSVVRPAHSSGRISLRPLRSVELIGPSE